MPNKARVAYFRIKTALQANIRKLGAQKLKMIVYKKDNLVVNHWTIFQIWENLVRWRAHLASEQPSLVWPSACNQEQIWLPKDIWNTVFRMLPMDALLQFSRTCKWGDNAIFEHVNQFLRSFKEEEINRTLSQGCRHTLPCGVNLLYLRTLFDMDLIEQHSGIEHCPDCFKLVGLDSLWYFHWDGCAQCRYWEKTDKISNGLVVRKNKGNVSEVVKFDISEIIGDLDCDILQTEALSYAFGEDGYYYD